MLIGTVDSNQVIVSPQVQGRLQKLLVDEGTPVKAGDLIAELDPAELEAQERAAAATIDSLRSKVAADALHRSVDQGLDHKRRGQRSGQAAIDEGAVGAGASNLAAYRKRQPTDD